MSMDLIAWKEPAVASEEDAAAVVRRSNESDDAAVFAPSEDVLRFYDELMARFPAVDRESTPEEDPWASAPERSDRVIEMSLRWSVPDQTLDAIVALARKHGLVLYDPQGPSLHSPEQPVGERNRAAEAWQA